MSGPLIAYDDLHVGFETADGPVEVLRGMSLSLAPGEVLGLVGESGSGKSVTCLAAPGLLGRNAVVHRGRIEYRGENLLRLDEPRLRRLRGDRLAVVFQDPMTSLNPFLTVEVQITEVLRAHRSTSRSRARRRARELLERCRVPEPDRCLRSHPHQLSGGMRQRVLIAIALALEPDVLFADEPTTALDVTTQAEILDLLRELREDRGTAMVFVTHDLGVVAGLADRVAIVYAGRVVEDGAVEAVFARPRHPYTRGLLAARPRIGGGRSRLEPVAGQPPRPGEVPPGCAFAPRCPLARDDCRAHEPAPAGVDGASDHRAACPVTAEEGGP